MSGTVNRSNRSLLLSILIAMLCAAIISPAAAAQTTPNPTTLRIGTLAFVTPDKFVELNPQYAFDALSRSIIGAQYVGLTRLERTTPDAPERAVLALAETHTQDAADPRIHYFTIRADAKFNDGTPITADTFARTLEGFARSTFETRVLDNARVEDGKLRLFFRRPVGLEEAEMLVSQSGYFPLDLRKATVATYNAAGAIGNGPYRVESVSADQVVLVRDPGYASTQPATNIDRIEIQKYQFPVALREALKSGGVDIIWRGLPLEYEAELITAGIQRQVYKTQSVAYLIFGLDQKPFDKVEARYGLSYFIKRDALLSNSYGDYARPLLSIVPSSTYNVPADALFSTGDPAEGKRILKTGGFTEFQQVQADLVYSGLLGGDVFVRAIDTLAGQFRTEKALRLAPRNLDIAAFIDVINQSGFQLVVFYYQVRVPGVDNLLYDFGSSEGELANAARYNNPKIDTLLEQLARTSGDQANSIRNQILTILHDDAPYIPLWEVDQTVYVRPDVGGIVVDSQEIIDLALLARQK